MLSPLPRHSDWRYCFAHFPQSCQPSLITLSGRPMHRPFRGLLGVHSRYGLHTRAVTVYRDTLSEGFSHFVTSIAAPVASGWSGCRVGLAPHWKAPPCHGARVKRTCRPAECQNCANGVGATPLEGPPGPFFATRACARRVLILKFRRHEALRRNDHHQRDVRIRRVDLRIPRFVSNSARRSIPWN